MLFEIKINSMILDLRSSENNKIYANSIDKLN